MIVVKLQHWEYLYLVSTIYLQPASTSFYHVYVIAHLGDASSLHAVPHFPDVVCTCISPARQVEPKTPVWRELWVSDQLEIGFRVRLELN